MQRLKTLFSFFELVMRRIPVFSDLFEKKPRLAKYLVAGSISTLTQLLLLYFFVHIFSLHYLLATSLAFIAALVVSFTLHKFWTFEDASFHAAKEQFISHATLGVVNLFVNGALMYLFVERVLAPIIGLPMPSYWYVLAQALASVLVAAESFFVYRLFIFGYLRRRAIQKSEIKSDSPVY